MVETPQKLRRLSAIAPAVALVFGLQAVGAQAHVRAGSIVSRTPLGASMPRGGGTAWASRTRAVAPPTSSWPARGRARGGLLRTPPAPAPATAAPAASAPSGASPRGSAPASAEPIVTTPTAGGSPPVPSPTAGSPPADTTPTTAGPPTGGSPTSGTDPEHPIAGGAHGGGPHPDGIRPAGTHPRRPRRAATPAPATHGGATKAVATKPVATKPVATSPVATPPVANLSGSVSIAPGSDISSGFSEATAPSRVRRLLAGLALEAYRLAAAGNRRAVLTPLRRELGTLIAAVRSLPPTDPATRRLAARLEQLNRVLAHLRAADGAAIRPLGPQLLALRALTTRLMRAGDEDATSLQPALSAARSADSVLLASSSSFMDRTGGLAASVRSVHASFEQDNDSAPHRWHGAMPSISQVVPMPAPSPQGGPLPGGAAAGLSGGIGTTGPPSIALAVVLALAVSILLSKRLAMDPETWRLMCFPSSSNGPASVALALSGTSLPVSDVPRWTVSWHRRCLTPGRHRTIDVGPRTTSGTGASSSTEEKQHAGAEAPVPRT